MCKSAPGRSSLSSQSYREQTLMLKKGLSARAGTCAMVGTVALDCCPVWWTVKDGWKGENKEESWRNKEGGREREGGKGHAGEVGTCLMNCLPSVTS